jgi:co-chaperonin GroES (HSP10)
MRISRDYLVVTKVPISKSLYAAERFNEDLQMCEIHFVSPRSTFMATDIILVGENIFFDKAPVFGDDMFFMYEDDVFGVIKNGRIIPRNDVVYIETDKNKHAVSDSGILKDISYDPLRRGNVVQDGVVLSVCDKAKNSYYYTPLEIEIEPGDHVYTHHFLTDKAFEREFGGKTYFEIKYEDIYCKVVDRDIHMLNDWNFVTPIEREINRTESGIFLELGSKSEMCVGLMQHPNKDMNMYPGDRCLFKKSREYEIDVEGHTYYRINNRDILYNLETMRTLGDIVVVRPEFKADKINGIVVRTQKDNLPEKGVVVSTSEDIDINEGDTILYRKAAYTEVTIDGEQLLLMSAKNVYVVL